MLFGLHVVAALDFGLVCDGVLVRLAGHSDRLSIHTEPVGVYLYCRATLASSPLYVEAMATCLHLLFVIWVVLLLL